MIDALLHTKLSMPSVRSDLVTRPRLTDLLCEGLTRPLTLISAPAGFGKTTLVAEWRAADADQDFQVAWFALDDDDNDLTRFLSYLIAALQTVSPDIDGGLSTIFQSPQPPSAKAVLTSLINRASSLQYRMVLVLDDYHLITAQPIHEVIAFLLDHLPPQIRLVLISRSDPPLALARLRARNQLAEIRAHDLRFTRAEAGHFLTEMLGIELDPEEVVALEARTEGWIAGLQLAALAMIGRKDISAFIAAFTGNHRFILDYLAEEVLNRQPQELQTFLMESAILDQVCAPLCIALTGQADAQAKLEHLARANLFVTPLDDEARWYRFHHLFADVLRHRLAQAEPERLPDLHRRASEWFEQNGLSQQAIGHALAAADFERAARLIEHTAFRTLLPMLANTLTGWLATFPDSFLRQRPSLLVIYGAALHLSNEPEAAEVRLQTAEDCVQANIPPEQARLILGRAAAVRANLNRVSGNISDCVAHSRRALELLPETDFMAVIATLNANYAHLESGDVRPATEVDTLAAVARVRATGNLFTYLRSITHLAWLYLMQGRLRQAAVTYEDAAREASDQYGLEVLAGSPAYYIGLGDLLYQWNDLKGAQTHLQRGLDLVREMRLLDADIITLAYTIMVRFKLGCGDFDGANEVLDLFMEFAQEHKVKSSFVARASAARTRVALRQGNHTAAWQWATASGLRPDDDLHYPREDEYQTLARVLITRGLHDSTHHYLEDALYLLGRLLQDAESSERILSVIEILILQSLAFFAANDVEVALHALERALSLAEPEGYVRLFVDEGAPMAALLREAALRGILPSYIAKILAALGDPGASTSTLARQPSRSATPPPSDSLTERELEVLRLIADGASNRDIARALVVSLGTVKKHVNNIFTKLDVQSRTQAVATARTLSLL